MSLTHVQHITNITSLIKLTIAQVTVQCRGRSETGRRGRPVYAEQLSRTRPAAVILTPGLLLNQLQSTYIV